jgi:hypothetical protein
MYLISGPGLSAIYNDNLGDDDDDGEDFEEGDEEPEEGDDVIEEEEEGEGKEKLNFLPKKMI